MLTIHWANRYLGIAAKCGKTIAVQLGSKLGASPDDKFQKKLDALQLAPFCIFKSLQTRCSLYSQHLQPLYKHRKCSFLLIKARQVLSSSSAN